MTLNKIFYRPPRVQCEKLKLKPCKQYSKRDIILRQKKQSNESATVCSLKKRAKYSLLHNRILQSYLGLLKVENIKNSLSGANDLEFNLLKEHNKQGIYKNSMSFICKGCSIASLD